MHMGPEIVLVFLVKLHGLLMILGDLETEPVLDGGRCELSFA